ncbi:MAG TPA: dipeptide/oligopeptide/nickel ABC transporter permease/ATP-binding protein, partial [Nitriliruptorales bacterium]|nr:dipeptide/oligopeptide/nickel ABC transporter permease/ATP-binding protein [Nitriliruptorales bacterium]
GTNDLGQDIFAQLLYGSRLSLLIGVLAGAFATGVGLLAGLLAGYYRGWLDSVIMRSVDLTLSLPFIPLVIVLAAFFGRGLTITVLVIGAVLWARPARILRSQVLKISRYQHVDASRAMGSSSLRTIGRHVLPRTAPVAVAQFVHAATIAVLIEASLAFLGLGDPQRVSWGTMLFFANSSNAMLTSAWRWWVLPPGLTLTAAVLGLAFIGVTVEQWGDRRLAGRTAGSLPVPRRERTPRAGPFQSADLANAPDVAVSVSDIHVVYETATGPVHAVDGVSFSVGNGRLVGLVGESGCGKSTLAMSLVGLTMPPGRIVSGSIVLGGSDLAAGGSHQAARMRGREVSLIPQNSMNALNPAYTAHHQIAEAAMLTRSKGEANARADELLEMVGLSDSFGRSFPHQLSGGMRQRVVIAMALANKPRLVIADEPLTGLDVVTQDTVVQLLLQLQARLGVAILLVSHDLPLVGHVADDLLVMYAGRIAESGPADVIMGDPRHPYTQELLRAFPTLYEPRGDLAILPGQPPDLRHPPPGCRFHPRCPKAFEDCPIKEPKLYQVTPDQHAACLLER